MNVKKWIEDSRSLRKERLDMLCERLSAEELIRYRDNCRKNDTLVRKTVMLCAAIGVAVLFILCLLEEFSVIDEARCNLHFGYTFGLTLGVLIFGMPTSYVKELNERIEKKLLEGVNEP